MSSNVIVHVGVNPINNIENIEFTIIDIKIIIKILTYTVSKLTFILTYRVSKL